MILDASDALGEMYDLHDFDAHGATATVSRRVHSFGLYMLGAAFTIFASPVVVCAQDRSALPELDSTLFGLAVKAIRDSAKGADFRVVVAPLNTSPAIVYPDARDYVALSAGALRLRTEALKRLGVESTPSMNRGTCLGAMVPIMDSNSNGCPARRVSLVAFSWPRRGAAYYPPVINDSAETDRNSKATIRVVETELGPGGAVTTAKDVVFALVRERWMLVGIVVLQYVE